MRVSGLKRMPTPVSRVVKADPGPSMLSEFGADSASTMKTLRNAARVEIAVGNAERPSNMYYRMTNHTTYWWAYNLMDFYFREVSIASTFKHRIPGEAFRYGLRLVPKFAFKCEDCGFEVDNLITECPVCHSHRLRNPDPSQKDYFVGPSGRSILEYANKNGQRLEEVLRQYAESQIQNNEAYTVCITGDIYSTKDGHLIRHYPLEFINVDPKFVRFLYDDTGTPGTQYAYTMDDRENMITLGTVDNEGVMHDFEFYSSKGMELYPAYWKIGKSYGAEGAYKLYSQEEVYHDHWLEATMTYGRPIWLDMEDDLLTYHYIEKHYLKLTKFGFIRKMIVLPGFADDSVEEITTMITDILGRSDSSIPIVCMPPQAPNTPEMKAQTLELGLGNITDYLPIKDEIRNRMCAHGGFPDIFAGDTETSGGMNNESQQITVFDRYLLGIYKFLDHQCEWIMSWYPMITDWKLIIDRPSRAITEYNKRKDEIQIMSEMKKLGHDYIYLNGNVYYSMEPLDQIQRKQQEQMAAQQQMAAMAPMQGPLGAPGGGVLPGDGEGPPEAGTARAENPEINSNKDELDQTQRDADAANAL